MWRNSRMGKERQWDLSRGGNNIPCEIDLEALCWGPGLGSTEKTKVS